MGYFLCFHDAFTYPDSIPFDGVVHRVSDFLKLYETPNAALQSTTCSQQTSRKKENICTTRYKIVNCRGEKKTSGKVFKYIPINAMLNACSFQYVVRLCCICWELFLKLFPFFLFTISLVTIEYSLF